MYLTYDIVKDISTLCDGEDVNVSDDSRHPIRWNGCSDHFSRKYLEGLKFYTRDGRPLGLLPKDWVKVLLVSP